MKKQIVIALTALLLAGCGAKETFETVADEDAQPVLAELREISLDLPADAAAPVLESGEGTVYECGDYEIHLQSLPGGNLSATVQSVTGYRAEDLTMLQTDHREWKRYDFVWASSSDEGDRIGKGCILDDGSYHYALTILGNAETAEDYQSVWQEILDSFTLA